MNNQVNVSFGTEKEESIGQQGSFVAQEGRITFTENNIYLGLGNGKYKKYDGLDTERKLTFNPDITTEGDAVASGTNVLFFNEALGKLQVTVRVGDNIITQDIFDDIVGQNDFKIYKADMQILLNAKANATEVYRKDETYSKNEIITLAGNFTTIEDKIAAEIDRSTKEDARLQQELDLKTKAVTYRANIKLNTHDFVVNGQEIYLTTTPFTTTGNFETDKANLYKLNSNSVGGTSVVDYTTNIKIEEGNMVIKDGGIYLCKNTIELTTDWDTDKVNMVDFSATIDLTAYYNKGQTDALLAQKMDIITPGTGVKVDKTDSNTTISADMDVNATAEKIVVRDTDGKAYAKNSNNPVNDELINAKTFNDKTSKINEEFQSLREEVSGREKEFFKMNQTLVIGQVGLAKPLEFQTNIPISQLTISYNKSSYVSVDLEKRTYTLLQQARREDFPIVCNITKSGSNIITLTINYDETDAVVSTTDYVSNSYKVYSFMIHSDRMLTEANQSDLTLFDKTTDADITAQLEKLKEKYKGLITLEDDAKGKTQEEILEWLGIKPCTFANGKKQVELDPNDFTKVKLTGEEAITAIGIDTMIEFPLRGLRFKKVANGYYISFTDNPNAEKDGFAYYAHYYMDEKKQAFYVGAYKGYSLNSKLYSTREVNFTNQLLDTHMNHARARGDGYVTMNFYMWNYIIACSMLCTQQLDSQVSIGYGIGSNLKSGCCDKFGMFNELAPLTKYTKKNNIYTKHLGIEGMFECWCETINRLWYENYNRVLSANTENDKNMHTFGQFARVNMCENYNDNSNLYVYSIICENEWGFFPSYAVNKSNGKRPFMMSTYEINNSSHTREYMWAIGNNVQLELTRKGLFTLNGCNPNYENINARLCYV